MYKKLNAINKHIDIKLTKNIILAAQDLSFLSFKFICCCFLNTNSMHKDIKNKNWLNIVIKLTLKPTLITSISPFGLFKDAIIVAKRDK